jgi:TPR repeat protein
MVLAPALLMEQTLMVNADAIEDGIAAYERGDYAAALKIWRPLAEQGTAGAQYNLGVAYAEGRGVPHDDAEAAWWWRMAADQGHVWAQHNLGVAYRDGDGVPQDYAEAVSWFRLAVEQGDADAQYNLGAMHGNGHGVPQDNVQAHIWFDLAAVQGYEKAQKYRDIAASEMTPDQIAEAQRMAREWMAKYQQ